MTEIKRIEGRAKTIREVLDTAKYDIDFYQREYAWEERQVREAEAAMENAPAPAKPISAGLPVV